jgi:hypothetical protein
MDPDAGHSATARRRRKTLAATALLGTRLLGASLSAPPGSRKFYGLTLATAATYTAGGLVSGEVPLAPSADGSDTLRSIVEPMALGAGAFGAFYGVARVARHVPALDHALSSVLRYAHHGPDRLVLVSAVTNGIAEEIYFRGALYSQVRPSRAVATSTAAYVLATTATRNPALVLASGVMGALFAAQRRATGGIRASTLTHVTWSALMLRYLPPLFSPPAPVIPRH